MEISVQDLAALVGGQFAAGTDPSTLISRASSIEDAVAGDVTFFGSGRYLPALKVCRATAALVPMDFSEDVPPVTIRVDDPNRAFAQILAKLEPPPIEFAPGIHPSALVSKSADIDSSASIQPYAVIEDGAAVGPGTVIGAGSYVGHEARIGAECRISDRVTIGARCRLADRVIVHSGVVIGSDGFGFEMSNGRHAKIPQTGMVQIDDDVEIGANTTIDRARFGRTWVGAGTKIDNLVQIAHNVIIGKHCIICAQVGISGSTRLGDYAVLGGQAGIIGHIEIGSGAQIGAQSGVSKAVPPKAILWGTPAAPLVDVKRRLAQVNRLGALCERVKALEQILGEMQKSSLSER
ncbi:MAG: UDP-3-O-(3-hydroxymyristoyl)glucosamine N-acyltransferase [Chthoniobacteraceae bacterium]